MIEYKLDKETNNSATAHIRDMNAVLKEISTTYQILLDVVEQQETALSSPSINNFRQELRTSVRQGISLAETITENSAKLVIISEQAGKHLAAIEDRFSAALEKPASRAIIR